MYRYRLILIAISIGLTTAVSHGQSNNNVIVKRHSSTGVETDTYNSGLGAAQIEVDVQNQHTYVEIYCDPITDDLPEIKIKGSGANIVPIVIARDAGNQRGRESLFDFFALSH